MQLKNVLNPQIFTPQDPMIGKEAFFIKSVANFNYPVGLF